MVDRAAGSARKEGYMMKHARIEKMTMKAVMEQVEGLGLDIDMRPTEAPVRKPGHIGITATRNGNLMVYMVDDGGKLYNTSVYSNKREANGRVLERAMAAARG